MKRASLLVLVLLFGPLPDSRAMAEGGPDASNAAGAGVLATTLHRVEGHVVFNRLRVDALNDKLVRRGWARSRSAP